MVAVESVLRAPVVAENVAEDAAAATMTEAGTVSAELLLERVTVAPPVGADCDRVTVQVLEEFGPRLAGLQAREETSTGATRLMAAFAELPL